jgi:hypothetical protein
MNDIVSYLTDCCPSTLFHKCCVLHNASPRVRGLQCARFPLTQPDPGQHQADQPHIRPAGAYPFLYLLVDDFY